MSDADKRSNEAVAEWLFKDWMGSKVGLTTLDVGSSFPWLAHSFGRLGCSAYGMDGEPHTFDGMKCTVVEGDLEWESVRLGAPRLNLITLVHTFEHLEFPLVALRKLRRLVLDDGFVFIRSPDHTVAGIERDLTPGHYEIHPFVHCLDSILQCLVELGDAFEVAWTSALVPGQRDIILRPITKRPTLGLAMIVRNEARDLPRCLDSIAPIIDAAVVIDTGSTDRTMFTAEQSLANVPSVNVDTYDKASEKDAAGNWQLWDFSKARNWSLEAVEAYRPTWITWMDGDDELLTPEAYRRAMYRGDVDTFAVTIDSGGSQWLHQRLWRASKKVRFKGRCHEFPIIDNCRVDTLNAIIRHHQDADASQEDSNARNLRILMREWEEGPNERTAFYIANTHRDAGRWAEAVEWYRKRISYGPNVFRDEYLFACLYLARALIESGDEAKARIELQLAENLAPDWCEFQMQRARLFYKGGKYYKSAIAWAIECVDAPIPPTTLWRERSDYTDGPCRLISWCYEHMGKIGKAMQWAVLAQDRIGKPDAEWDARVASLKARVIAGNVVPPPPKIMTNIGKVGPELLELSPSMLITRGRKERIALVRPGAIGDVLMTLNLLPAFKEANPDAEVHYFTAVEGLTDIIKQAGAHAVGHPVQLSTVPFDRIINLVGYPLSEGYPEKPMRRHLLSYFAEELGLQKEAWDYGAGVSLPSLELPLPTRPSWSMVPTDPYITWQWETGWSRYKEWEFSKWKKAISHLRGLGIVIDPISKERDKPLQEMIALFANARMHIGVDSFPNHLTNYFWRDGNKSRRVPGVILWGSTQMEAAGYPTNINIGHRLPCGPCFRENPAISKMPRGPCVTPPRATYEDDTPHECMRLITVDEVVTTALKLWEESA